MGLIVASVFLILAVVVALGAIKIVPQGREYTVEQFGRYTRTLKPGISFLTPFVEGIGRKINMMEQVLDVPRQDVITKDNVSMQIETVVYYRAINPYKLVYKLRNDTQQIREFIKEISYSALRSVMGENVFQELLEHRSKVA